MCRSSAALGSSAFERYRAVNKPNGRCHRIVQQTQQSKLRRQIRKVIRTQSFTNRSVELVPAVRANGVSGDQLSPDHFDPSAAACELRGEEPVLAASDVEDHGPAGALFIHVVQAPAGRVQRLELV